MRIECDSCAAKYSVADAKIKTSAFKLRCKQCREFIVVRDHPQPSKGRGLATMTSQRSDDSVLFSLEDIAPPGVAKQASMSRPATHKPVAGGSGLIDIRQMREALLASEPRAGSAPAAQATREDASMPSFVGAGLGGLCAEPLVLTPPPAAPPPPQGNGTKPLYALIALLTLGVFGLGAYVALDEPAPAMVKTIVEAPVTAQPEAAEPPAQAAVDEAASEAEPEAEGEGEASEAAAPAPADKPTRNRNRNRNRNRTAADTKPETKPASADTSTKPGSSVDVDCLLDNSLDKCGNKAKPKPPVDDKPPAQVAVSDAADLPNKLGASQISKGVAPVKSKTKSCGSATTVAVKFSVEGKSGTVISARALEEHASSSVGACVVSAAKQASFPRFAAAQQGFTIKFRL